MLFWAAVVLVGVVLVGSLLGEIFGGPGDPAEIEEMRRKMQIMDYYDNE